MSRVATLLLVGLVAVSFAAGAERSVDCGLAIYQSQPADGKEILLFADTVDLVEGVPASGFLVAFSAEFELTAADSTKASFNIHAITLGANASTLAKAFTVEYGLPARMSGIKGKNGAIYSLAVTPLGLVDPDMAACPFNHRLKGTFSFLPTANTDIYFVPNSLGDYYFQSVKEVMESQYRNFQALFAFSLPGKYAIYLCPCRIRSVIWDKRFNMSSDPTRNAGFAIYNSRMSTADPFLLILTAIMRNWGYAPPFLSEGLAGYLSVAVWDMREIFKQARNVPLSKLLSTYEYFRTDPHVADRSAASFVRYLVDTYNLEKFSKLYHEADDLNLPEKMVQIYGKSLESLEAEWKAFCDTVRINAGDLGYQTHLSEMMFDYPSMLKYAGAALEISKDSTDSSRALTEIKRASFFNGDYYGATSAQEALTARDTSSAANWMAQGGYRMMNGLYAEASRDFDKALALDPFNKMSRFNLGLCKYYQKDRLGAIAEFRQMAGSGGQEDTWGESRVMLAEMLMQSGSESDRAEAKTCFGEAKNIFGTILASNNASPSSQMWMGIACAGLGEYDDAAKYLQTALFLETRPFYLGMMNLWLGKVYDLKHQRDSARACYGNVLALPSADYHQKEARQYLDRAYAR